MDLDIDGNTALVTASSRGLGRGAARALAREGANVVINGRDPDHLEETVAELDAEATGSVVGQQGDLTDPDDVEALVERPVEEFGGLDHLVTSAGGPPSKPFTETTDREWYQTYDLLVMSVVWLLHEAVEPLKNDGGGTVVTITSRSVKEAAPHLVLSNAVRMAVVGLTKTVSKELGPDIRANSVLPGTHETSRIRELVEDAVARGEYDSYEEGLAAWSEDIPLDRMGDPEEFGWTVAFLCSPRSGFVNGTSLLVDGGAGRSGL